ncbi:hypothetical protein ACNUDN_05976 [Mycobacterium sp. smrl_JER01]
MAANSAGLPQIRRPDTTAATAAADVAGSPSTPHTSESSRHVQREPASRRSTITAATTLHPRPASSASTSATISCCLSRSTLSDTITATALSTPWRPTTSAHLAAPPPSWPAMMSTRNVATVTQRGRAPAPTTRPGQTQAAPRYWRQTHRAHEPYPSQFPFPGTVGPPKWLALQRTHSIYRHRHLQAERKHHHPTRASGGVVVLSLCGAYRLVSDNDAGWLSSGGELAGAPAGRDPQDVHRIGVA